MARRAIILFNLGGPNNLSSVEPFLYNLFKDKAIINLPNIIRLPLARIISKSRGKKAKRIYSLIGGKSPLVDITIKQAKALENSLKTVDSDDEFRVFISMRYWHPMSLETIDQVEEYNPDVIILVPLYPHFSITTTGSSFTDWKNSAQRKNLKRPTYSICCYHLQNDWIKAQSDLLAEELKQFSKPEKVKVLFSAHSLPKSIIKKGDPYQFQVEESAKAIAQKTKLLPNLWEICYQSKVGPMQWIGPSLEEALEQAASEGLGVVVLPISFVSDHSETLVELDIEYRNIALKMGIENYRRVPAANVNPDFIESLRKTVLHALTHQTGIGPSNGSLPCSSKHPLCPNCLAAN